MKWVNPNKRRPPIAVYVFCLLNRTNISLGFRAHSGWYIYTTNGKKYIHHGNEDGIKITGWREIPIDISTLYT